jgi:CPA2 family monovalent cation:H+ antiporter-2
MGWDGYHRLIMASSLDLTLLYLLAAVAGVVVFRSLKLPPILGYLVVGVLIGPNALALAQDTKGIRYLAEFGVVFLMFVLGLEFSLPKLRAMRRHVFGLGVMQVVLTMVAVVLAAMGLRQFGMLADWHLTWQDALALGGAMAMSSTAILVKLISERLELDSEHGRRVIGVLLFQDLAVVPLLVLIPALGAKADELAWALTLAVFKATVLLVILLTVGQTLMRKWLTLVARRKSDELFVLNILLITLGFAWLTEHAGLSLALGAFVAGMLISETEYKHQVETDIKPFHDVLLGLFFITIGMLLDWRQVWQNIGLVVALTLLPVLFKFGLVTALAKLTGASSGTALRTGLYLAQAGEFGFVLLTLADQSGLIAPKLINPILASMVLSMLATPFIILASNRIVMRVSSSEWLLQSVAMTSIAKKSMNTQKHIIICGYGRCGQNLARLLEAEHIPYIALDLDPDRVREAAAAGHSVVFGDAARLQALMAAGLARASAVAVTYLDTPSALKVLTVARQHAPTVPVLVRTLDDADLDRLRAAGAAEVVPEAIEGSLMLASHALALVGVPMRRVIRTVQNQRDARYGLLRGYFHGADDDTADEVDHERLHSITLPVGAPSAGKPLAELRLNDLGADVVALRRDGVNLGDVAAERLSGGDTVVLYGTPAALALAEDLLLKA